jgi:hypothetical protein
MIREWLAAQCPMQFPTFELVDTFLDFTPPAGSALRAPIQEYLNRLKQQLHRRSSDFVSFLSINCQLDCQLAFLQFPWAQPTNSCSGSVIDSWQMCGSATYTVSAVPFPMCFHTVVHHPCICAHT